jgi:transglutaminase-like putative cysteine protease
MKHAPAIALFLALAILAAPGSADDRRISFSYRAEIGPIPDGAGPIHVFIPVPRETSRQQVESLEIDSVIPGAIETEPVYGNRFWHGRLKQGTGTPFTVTLKSVIRRHAVDRAAAEGKTPAPLAPSERALFLGPNRRVVVSHEVLEPILREIRTSRNGGDRAATARGIYDWVVDNVTYKKVGNGWGNGDTFWACSERYGNCTDFHSLFISLARTEGIPARFEMGFPVPEDRPAGEIAGYHCWVDFHLEESGWTPIDASEASKHPEKRELFYGSQPPDRIHFSTGRDLRLGPDHRGDPLNYFVYPYVEVAGEPWTGPLAKEFRFQEVSAESRADRAADSQIIEIKEKSGSQDEDSQSPGRGVGWGGSRAEVLHADAPDSGHPALSRGRLSARIARGGRHPRPVRRGVAAAGQQRQGRLLG